MLRRFHIFCTKRARDKSSIQGINPAWPKPLMLEIKEKKEFGLMWDRIAC